MLQAFSGYSAMVDCFCLSGNQTPGESRIFFLLKPNITNITSYINEQMSKAQWEINIRKS